MAGKIQKGDVLVIRYEGPKGSPGMPEMLSPGSALVGAGLGKYVALVTDGRFSGASHGIMVGHAAVGGPIGLLVDGDMVTVRPGNRELSELAARRREWQPPAPKPGSFGTLGKYASQVHRVYLNDPSLESLDFGCFHVPRGDLEPRILPKLFKALASNTHLKQLMLGNTGLESDKGLHWDVAEACHGKIQKCSAQKPEETGTVNSWNVQRQFGFVSCDSSRQDVFLHAEAFKDLDVRDRVKKSGLQRGDHVRFDVKDTGRGKKPEAKNVELDEQGRAGDRKRGRSRRSDSRSPPRRRSSDCFRIGETEGCINQLADALRSNSTLQKLDLQANFLEMCDLTVIFEALSENTGLQDLKVNFQACAKQSFKDSMLEQGNDVYKAAAAAFRTNRSLIKLDLILLQRHWQDQICRGLMQNRQELRKSEIVTRAGG
eukprot:symbB.v1.2.025894.t1/scaffold2547.1/size76550/6